MILRTLPLLLAPALASLSLSTGLHAQARCVDSLAGALWRQTPLTAMVVRPAPGDRATDRYADAMLPLLAQRYRDPAAAGLPDGVLGTISPVEQRPPVTATISIALDRRGTVLDARIEESTGRPRLDSALVAAARGPGPGGGFGKVPRQMKGDTVQVTVQMSDRFPPGPRRAPFGSVSSSYLVATVAPTIRSMPPARAPRGRRGREVTLAATVSSAGRVVPGTIRVVSTNDSSLVAVARRSLEQAVYRPGTAHGCPAESNIRQRFPFP